MKSLIIIIVSFLFILTSCNQANNDSGQTQQTPVTSSENENLMKADTSPGKPMEAEKATETPAEQKKEVVMLNPAHGQPNHRCDIPVGAPLNSAPAPKTTTATTATNTSNTPVQANETQVSSPANGTANSSFSPTVENASKLNTPQAQRTSTTPKTNQGPKPATNPAHGQPYHRCDIAVGSPLP
jgi:hypothetical protein